jgi:hypothetical protein
MPKIDQSTSTFCLLALLCMELILLKACSGTLNVLNILDTNQA